MMDSFLSILPKGFFGLNNGADLGRERSLASTLMLVDDSGRKRSRYSDEAQSGCRTPTLVVDDGVSARPFKRFRGERNIVPVSPVARKKEAPVKKEEPPLSKVPEDVLAHCLSFLGGVNDRFSLQCTSRQFRRISNSDEMLSKIQVGGDRKTGLHGIIQENDTPETATKALTPFAEAGNLEAIYMLGIIKSYCHMDVDGGVCLLKHASCKGYVRASYALGLALRDSEPREASKYMKMAADAGYIPALQELLPARKMKAKYGEPKADELRLHLDPICLNRLLSRFYVESPQLRDVMTSHCWNPLCGRWAFKASHQPLPQERNHLGFHFRRSPTQRSDSMASTIVESEESDANATPTTAGQKLDLRVSRMKMCSRCCRAKYCSKLCQVYDWRSGRHKLECQFL